MMAYSEDHIALAAEYALGTLDADERAQVETMMAVDEEFAAMVQAWEFRLGVLNQMVGSVEPRPIVWENIRDRDRHSEPQAPHAMLAGRRRRCRRGGAVAASAGAACGRTADVADNSNVIQLSRPARGAGAMLLPRLVRLPRR